ncbi:hypothetical protein [uncultured Flavobacterium sp.]|uniref:hypothetical protein n=1 Tax=uncultured Flavobacterium sp. TaxID=165435 RepID=UPI00262F83C7|nr:hypothetical protein [uncultured Flavobacterium sp.]
MSKKILIVHPYDKSTNFLERIKSHLQSKFLEDCHYFSIKPQSSSHKQCLSEINNFSEEGLILFMGHGKSNCLYGAKGDYYGTLENELVKEESPEKYFYEDNFINDQNIDIFKNKKVISLSCNSNGQIGKKAVEYGAKVFLGFGDLPTSVGELEDKGEESKTGTSLSTIEQAIKTEINYIIKRSIEIGIVNKHSFLELVNLIHFITNQRISDYLVYQKKISERKLIANYLYDFKKEIKIFGDKNEKLID